MRVLFVIPLPSKPPALFSIFALNSSVHVLSVPSNYLPDPRINTTFNGSIKLSKQLVLWSSATVLAHSPRFDSRPY